MADGDPKPDPRASKLVPVCAIGASAGGVRALQSLFRQVPDNLGLAYVVILHLAPDHPSALGEVLAVCTRMPVLQVTDGPTLRANTVYVIAPDSELVIDGDSISARPFTERRGQRAPIDLFFRSVAASRGDGIAIILSGAGSDGATGVRSMKEAGAVIMVQEPAEAEFSSMPKSALATGVVDFVAPVARLAERLQEVAESREAVRSLDTDAAATELRRIVGYLRGRTGHDFSSYKRATVMRRVARRMQVCRLDSLAAYGDYLQASTSESKELFADLLISVTMFFRDPRAFEALAHHAVRPLVDAYEADPDSEGVRAWVVGCATGEEAYSLAMLLLEEAASRKLVLPVQIFATDLDEAALAIARDGRYPRSIEADVSEERLSRFFIDEGSHYRLRKEVRALVVFAAHSVLKEPPFMRLDLVSCRNLLIYLERSLQQQLCAVFHYALRRGGVLFLGSAESADMASDLFTSVDREARLYASRDRPTQPLPILPQFPTPERLADVRYIPPPLPDRTQAATVMHAAALEQSAPPNAVVDATQNITSLSPSVGRFILHPAGPLSSVLPTIVRPELRLDLKLALVRAFDHDLPTLTQPVIVGFGAEQHLVAMHVAPINAALHEGRHALVCFLDGGLVDHEKPGPGEARPEEVVRLQAELRAAQEGLIASRASHDATIQDLRAANEELQSTNEEYRSTAEELETSREELQSINEELHTLNAELKSKLEHLSSAHSDLQNLTAVTEIGTLFLDADLRIKMFTPPIADIINLSAFDIGRAITDFTNRLDGPSLTDEVRQVLADLNTVEREVRSSAGRTYVMRVRPYRTIEDQIRGVVLTFVDITARLEMEKALGRSEQQFRALVRASSQVLFRMNPDWSRMHELFGGGLLAGPGATELGWLDQTIPAEDRDRVRSVIARAIATTGIFDLEHRVIRTDGSIGWTHTRAIPILDDENQLVEWFGSADDVTSHRRAQEALRESEERLRLLVEGIPEHLWRSENSGRWTWSSGQWHRYTGLSDAESRGHGWLAAVHPDDRDSAMTAWHASAGSRTLDFECRLRHIEHGEYRWFRGRAMPVLDDRGRVSDWIGTFTDVHDLRLLQNRQQVLLAELQHRVRNILAVIRAIAGRTAETSATAADYAAHFMGRLGSLARTQAVLTRQPGMGIDLEIMIRDELLYQATQEDQVAIEGPRINLSAKAAEVLTLAIHELATNAVKYGALSEPRGTVTVRWERTDTSGEPGIVLHWTEAGVRIAVAAPRREGFGLELIQQRVPYELDGTGTVDFLPGGIHAVIAFPLRSGDSILSTDARPSEHPSEPPDEGAGA